MPFAACLEKGYGSVWPLLLAAPEGLPAPAQGGLDG